MGGYELPNEQANMKSFAVFAAIVGSALCAPAADPYTVTGLTAGPLTAAFGDLASTKRGLRPVSLEGFSEDVNQDGFVDPLVQAAVPVAHPVSYAAAPLGVHFAAAAPVVKAVELPKVEVKAVELPKVEVKAVEVPKVEVAAPVYYNAVHAPAVHAIHAVAPAVATVPVVQYGLQHTVQQIPQVHVQKHVSTHTTHHVINHAPVVGSYLHGLPVATTAVVADAPAAAEAATVEEA